MINQEEQDAMTPERRNELMCQEYVTPNQAAGILGVSYPTVMRRIEKGTLEAETTNSSSFLMNRRWRIPTRALWQYLGETPEGDLSVSVS